MSPQPADESTLAPTEFTVGCDGTLRLSGYSEAESRRDLYDYVADSWSDSPRDLVDAMRDCEPLSWAVHAIYSAHREAVETKLADAIASKATGATLATLRAQLSALPSEPEDGAKDWLLTLAAEDFAGDMVPKIDSWFDESPDWSAEGDHLESSTAQGLALDFFRDMEPSVLDVLGVDLTEGEFPGSSYYAARLVIAVDDANRAALAAGVPVRFLATAD